jgi:hypothetical protein
MVFKILHVIFLASFKYILMIPYAKLIGLNYSQALVAVLIGGIGSFLFFYYLSNWTIRKFSYIRPFLCRFVPQNIKKRYQLFCERKAFKPKKVFSRKSRLIVRLKKTYGLWGIIIATPILLTIPLGAFLTSKYYSRKKNIVGYMLVSIVGWALVLTTALHIFPHVFK